MAERLRLRPDPSVYGAFTFILTAMAVMGGVLFWSFAARQWSADAQRAYWGAVAALLLLLVGLTVRFMRRAPKTQL